MPLPDSSTPWPPPECHRPMELYDEWAAWYAGDPAQLARVYGGGSTNAPYGLPPRPRVRSSQYSGGLRGRVARYFWGAPPDPSQMPSRLHVPIGSDLAAVNADLLFGEMPTFDMEDQANTATQDRLDDILTHGGMAAALLEAAEISSPYGGVYLRVSWNTEVSDYPIVEPIAPDCAAPEWVGQHLRAVTFWHVLADENQVVIRHLERHEPGRVFHGLYTGSPTELGQKLPLTDHPVTEPFAAMVDADGGIATGAKGLAVEYIPNMRPHRMIRGTPLGRSDYSGVEPLMDALDEAWSSWMRDIRLAKGRLIVPESFLDSAGRGQGAVFDSEREIYAGVQGMQGPGDNFASMMTPVQFDIRVEEHSRTCTELTEQIVRGAGYSAQTFGESKDLAPTATEVRARERRTYSTRGRKVGYWQPGTARFTHTVLEIDVHVFKTKGVVPARPRMEWPDGVQEAPLQIAQTVQALDAAAAASTEVKVRMVHADWDDDQVTEEVEKIRDDASAGQDAASLAGLVSRNGPRPDQPQQEDGNGGPPEGRAEEGGQRRQGGARQAVRRPVPDPKSR